jgi:Flp pilus assembly protein TadD
MGEAEAAVRRDDYPKAAALLESHLRTHPEDVPARALLVRVLALSSRLDLARRECEALKAYLPPGSPRPAIELGHAYELSHDYERALASYDEAAAMAPTSPDGPRIGGLRAARWGEAEMAVPRLEEAVRRGADDAETLHALGLARMHLGRLDDAETAYRTATRRHPEATDAWLGLATVALVKHDHAAALVAYERLVALRPTSPDASLGRAYALARLGRTAEARRELDRAEKLGAKAVNLAKQRAWIDANEAGR